MGKILGPDGKPLADHPRFTDSYNGLMGAIAPIWLNRKLPYLSFWVIEQMLNDPMVKLGLKMLKAPIRKATLVVKCKDSRIREFVVQQLQTVWRRPLVRIMRALEYGYSASEMMFTEKSGRVHIKTLRDVHPKDARALTYKHQWWGMRVRNVDGGHVDVPGMYGLWHAHDAHWGSWYGRTVLSAVQVPWDEKAAKDGALDSRKLWYYKYSFQGPVIRYPIKDYAISDSMGTVVMQSARDMARQIVEQQKNGGTLALPNTVGPSGLQEWLFEPATLNGAGGGAHDILEYIKDLDREITRGMEIPDEVLMSDGTGALAGRRVPERAFYASREDCLVEILDTLIEQQFEPLVEANFGKEHAEFDILVADLMPDEQQAEPPNGGFQPPPNSPPLQRYQPAPEDSLRLSRDEVGFAGGRIVGRKASNQRTTVLMSAKDSPLPTNVAASHPLADCMRTAAEAGLQLSKYVKTKLRKLFDKSPKAAPGELARQMIRLVGEVTPEYANILAEALKASWITGAAGVAKRLPARGTAGAPTGNAASHSAEPPSGPVDPGDSLAEGELFDDTFVKFPAMDSALEWLDRRSPLPKNVYDSLADQVKNYAFTIAHADSLETMRVVQSALHDTLAEGPSLQDFKLRIDEAFDGSPFGEAHLETVYRTNMQTAFSAGQDATYNHPIVRQQFPYRAYNAIRDGRVRATHEEMMYLGLPQGGTRGNVYRSDDPVWNRWTPPAGMNCRCDAQMLTLEQAAALGVNEAVAWLRTGKPPEQPTFCDVPIDPDPGFGGRPTLYQPVMMAVDASGHEHKGKGEGGGQFTGSGSESIGKGSTGEVNRIGNEVHKNATKKESEVYAALRGVEGIAKGRTEGGKIITPYFKNIVSVDDVPKDRRKSFAPIVSKAYPKLVAAMTALSRAGYDYNDPLQVGFDENRTPHIFDFSMANKSGEEAATDENLGRLSTYLKEFGAERLEAGVSHVAEVRRAMLDVDNELIADEPETKDAKRLLSQLDGEPASNLYIATNARTIPGVAQTENRNGFKVIASPDPLSDEFLKQWEITPVLASPRAIKNSTDPNITMAVAHAPAGYSKDKPLTIDGKSYVGGEFIPGKSQAEVDAAVKKQKLPVADKSTTKKKPEPEAKSKTAVKAKIARTAARPASAKSQAAKAAYVPTNKEVQRYSEEYNEPLIAKMAGGVSFPDSEAVDIAVPIDEHLLKHWQSVVAAHAEALAVWEQMKGVKGRGPKPERGDLVGQSTHGIEVKTMVSSKHGKLTMNAYAQVRKIDWERENKAVYHTIVADDRLVYNANGEGQHGDIKKRVYYYRRGSAGSAYVHAMHKCESMEEVKKLMSMPEKLLPEGAKRTDDEWRIGKWKYFEDKSGKGYKNDKTGKIVRPKK